MRTALVLCLVLAFSGCAAVPMGLRHNEIVDGNSISYVTTRGGAPTVVFESGLGDGLSVWGEVYSAVGAFSNVFAYSRPGYSAGISKISFGDERTARDSAELLSRLLDETDIPGPYVLVGHSIGGLYMLEFARRNPEKVAGLVLVDARLPGFTERCEEAGISPCLPPASALVMAPLHVEAEVRGIRPSERSAPAAGELGDMPAILLAATKPPPGAPRDAQRFWLAVQEDYAASMRNGRVRIAEGSGHYIQRDAPALVVEAIREMVIGVEP